MGWGEAIRARADTAGVALPKPISVAAADHLLAVEAERDRLRAESDTLAADCARLRELLAQAVPHIDPNDSDAAHVRRRPDGVTSPRRSSRSRHGGPAVTGEPIDTDALPALLAVATAAAAFLEAVDTHGDIVATGGALSDALAALDPGDDT